MAMQKAPYFVGLDIGTSSVRCVIGMMERTDLETKISVIGVGTAVNTGMRKGTVVHLDEVSTAIAEAIAESERMAGVRVAGATINVNGAHVSSLPSHGVVAISSPSRKITDDDRARVEEAATVINLPANREIIQVFAKNYKIDGQDNIKDPVGMQGVRLEVDTVVVTAGIPLLRNLDTAIDKAQVAVHNHTVSSLAAAEAVLDRKQKESGVAVIDIGAGTTNIVVIEEGEVEYVSVIPIGSQNLTNDLAIGLKTDLDIAEAVKKAHASLDDSIEPPEEVSVEHSGKRYSFSEKTVRMVVEARIDELLEQIEREFKKIGKSRKLPGGVVVVGGMANMPGIAEYFKDALQLPAKTGIIQNTGGFIDTVNAPEYATAVGLMMLDMLLSDTPLQGGIMGMAADGAGLFNKIKKIFS
jgi:cell division protein FtsA